MSESEPNTPSTPEEKRALINSETAKIAWAELQRFFAQGYALGVSPELDLVEVALHVSDDNKQQVEVWIEAGLFGPVSDAQALEWLEAKALMWAVVVKPWILVQPILQQPEE